METQTAEAPGAPGTDFIRDIVEADLKSGKHKKIVTRFPPEPNGYLHIGHAKSICLNFGVARQYGGVCHLRFDDTNPAAEDVEYVESIQEDVKWLGFDWKDKLFYASDYFEATYDYAVELVKRGKAYVCDLSLEEVRRTRGNFQKPGEESPYRGRSVPENLDLFARMRAGEFADGSRTLRAKIDMASPNMTSGASTRCTTTPIPSRTPKRASPTRSAPWSSRTTDRSTIGLLTAGPRSAIPGRSSSRGSP